MRYYQVPTVSFTTFLGDKVAVKDMRPRPGRAVSSYPVTIAAGATLDEVATRPDTFGDGAEGEAYRIFEENDLEIVESGLDLSKLKSLRIPR